MALQVRAAHADDSTHVAGIDSRGLAARAKNHMRTHNGEIKLK